MSLPLTVSCFSKTFLVPAHPGCPGQRAVNWVGVCNSSSMASLRHSGYWHGEILYQLAALIKQAQDSLSNLLGMSMPLLLSQTTTSKYNAYWWQRRILPHNNANCDKISAWILCLLQFFKHLQSTTALIRDECRLIRKQDYFKITYQNYSKIISFTELEIKQNSQQ